MLTATTPHCLSPIYGRMTLVAKYDIAVKGTRCVDRLGFFWLFLTFKVASSNLHFY